MTSHLFLSYVGIDFLCFDKTGTLTEDDLSVYGVHPCAPDRGQDSLIPTPTCPTPVQLLTASLDNLSSYSAPASPTLSPRGPAVPFDAATLTTLLTSSLQLKALPQPTFLPFTTSCKEPNFPEHFSYVLAACHELIVECNSSYSDQR